ncbi:MAG TPA: type II toxin-antitoxin system RelE/ParE family toxin [Thermomicrobiales bacterium]|jgi:toxin ParE1/3/4
MSSRKRPVALSPRAELDYADILLDSLLTWGEAQARRYQAALDHALNLLGEFPETAPRRLDLPPGFRGRLVERHVIYYRIEPDRIHVNHILHERREVRLEDLE